MADDPTVFVVDDDAGSRESICRLISSVGLPVEAYGSAKAFLDAVGSDRPGCLVTDIRMPGMSGLELQEHLAREDNPIPVIFITAYADVPMAVRSMRAGAVDFIEKPYRPQQLLERIQQAVEVDVQARRERLRRAELQHRLDRLTAREREVLALVVGGQTSRQIALQLGLSPKTVHAHRAEIMSKMQSASVAELVHLTLEAQPPSDRG